MPDAALGLLVRTAIGLLPVTLFLLALVWLDSYKLVRPRAVALAIVAGGVAAGLSYAIHSLLLAHGGIDRLAVRLYVAPALEELLKALVLYWLIRSGRVGFLVDPAIYGFALGTGFALVENLYYLGALPDARIVVWIVRGFGTAIMHGGTTAIFGIVSKTLVDRRESKRLVWFLPGFAGAVLIHSVFNHFLLSPVLMAVLIVVGLVPLVLAVFTLSDRALQGWLDRSFDSDVELLELIDSGRLPESPIGRYIGSLRQHFRGEVVADMLCYLRLHVELALRAKGILMLRESGFPVAIEPEVKEKLVELDWLERSIGPTGRLAILPVLRRHTQDVWQLQLLGRG